MLYLLAASSPVYTDPRQLQAALSCSLCSSIPPPSRILQPQLAQVLLHCSVPLASRQTGMSQGAGLSEMERAAERCQETVLPGTVVAGMRRIAGLVLGARLWEIPGTGLGSARSSAVTVWGLGSSPALAQDGDEEHGGHGSHRAAVGGGSGWAAPVLGVQVRVGLYVCVSTRMKGHLCVCEGQRLCVHV